MRQHSSGHVSRNKLQTLFLKMVRVVCCGLLCCAHALAAAQSNSTTTAPGKVTNYTITLTALDQHLVNVEILLPEGPPERELQLPVWNALYQVRDFAQYVNWVRAKDRSGKPLAVYEEDKSRWRITGAQAGAIIVYQIFVNSFGPFGAQLNSHHAFFNLAQVLMYPVDARNAAMTVRFSQLPEAWRIATPLQSLSASQFSAANYDQLVDSPIEMGIFQESDFDENGAHYRVIVDADSSDYNMQKIVGELHKIVAAATSWMDDRPFNDYMFIYHFPRGPAGGGMEHAFSTAIDINAEMLKESAGALSSVSAHEFFHLWNVKRIRPQALEPVDYTKENYTRALWFSEGVTSAAEGIIQLRAGLLDGPGYFERLGEQITELEERPAHLTQSAEESSLDAWLEGDAYYRRPDRSISYYNKGELLGEMLDLEIREASHGQASLREVLQWMNQNYAQKGRFFPDSDGIRQAAEAVSHTNLSWFFSKYVAGTEEIPWNDFFRTVGLRVIETTNTVPDAGFVASRNFDGPMTIASVTAGSDAERDGLAVGDTILEFQGRPAAQDLRQELAQLKPGDLITLKVRGRRGGERELKWKVGGRQEVVYQVKDLDNVTVEQSARRAAWLKGEAQTATSTALPSRTPSSNQ
jgi:predicted metalloprotease with PDZ domain